jgi:uncharacterized protein (UPF0332 family)
MSYPDDLLRHARALVEPDRETDNPADLSRAVSAAYYSVFHLLIDEASRLAAADPRLTDESQAYLIHSMRRQFDHKKVRDLLDSFSNAGQGNRPKWWFPDSVLPPEEVSEDLKSFAKTFHALNEQREAADYRIEKTVSHQEATTAVSEAEKAIATWRRIRENPEVLALLAAMLLDLKPRR